MCNTGRSLPSTMGVTEGRLATASLMPKCELVTLVFPGERAMSREEFNPNSSVGWLRSYLSLTPLILSFSLTSTRVPGWNVITSTKPEVLTGSGCDPEDDESVWACAAAAVGILASARCLTMKEDVLLLGLRPLILSFSLTATRVSGWNAITSTKQELLTGSGCDPEVDGSVWACAVAAAGILALVARCLTTKEDGLLDLLQEER